MFIINEDKSIYITRGDVAFFSVKTETETGEAYIFQAGDVVRFKVFEKKACENVVLQKDFGIEAETEEVGIYLEEKDTKIGDVISKPVDYWYEVELNPYTDPQTIIGYDEDGAKIFKLFPEGNEKEDDEPITPEDIPVVDEALDLTSTRPVQNQAIARAILKINDVVKAQTDALKEEVSDWVEDAKAYVDSKTTVEIIPVDTYCKSVAEGVEVAATSAISKFGEIVMANMLLGFEEGWDTSADSGLAEIIDLNTDYMPCALLAEFDGYGMNSETDEVTPVMATYFSLELNNRSSSISLRCLNPGITVDTVQFTATYIIWPTEQSE